MPGPTRWLAQADPCAEDFLAPALDATSVHLWWLPRLQADRRVRALLAAYARVPTAALEFRRGAHGKPILGDSALDFNLSNSGERALVAVAHGTCVGVDLEREQRRLTRGAALVERCFSAAEAAAIAAQDDPRRALLRAWCAKEALVKAIGRGIAYGLRHVELGLDPVGVPHLIALHGPAAGARQWQLLSLDPRAGYLSALAYAGAERQVHAFNSAG